LKRRKENYHVLDIGVVMEERAIEVCFYFGLVGKRKCISRGEDFVEYECVFFSHFWFLYTLDDVN
jgi:hypothetical protein